MSKVLNHETGRLVKVDGPTGKRVLKKIRDEPDEYISMLQSKNVDQDKIMQSLRNSRVRAPDEPVVAAGDVNAQEVRPPQGRRLSAPPGIEDPEDVLGGGPAGGAGGTAFGKALRGLPDLSAMRERQRADVRADAERSKREAERAREEAARAEAAAAAPAPPAPPAPPAAGAGGPPPQQEVEVGGDASIRPAEPAPEPEPEPEPEPAPEPAAEPAADAPPAAAAPAAAAPAAAPAAPVAPDAPAPAAGPAGPAESAATDEDQAIKAAAANPNILDDRLDINLIGKDSPEELREASVVYRDLIDKIFQSHSFIRLSKQTAEEPQYKEMVASDDKVVLYQHAEKIVDIYRDHLGIEKPRYDISADVEVLKDQIHELYTIARHVRNNLGRQDKGAVLNSFNKVGVIVSASSMGLTLESLMAWAQQNKTLGGDTARVVPSSEKRQKHPVSKIPDGDLEPDKMLERPAELVDHDTGEFKSGDKELELEAQAVEKSKDQMRGAAGSRKNKVRRVIPDLTAMHDDMEGADSRLHQEGQVHRVVPKSKTQIKKNRYTIC
jgi:hypothetical protein